MRINLALGCFDCRESPGLLQMREMPRLVETPPSPLSCG